MAMRYGKWICGLLVLLATSVAPSAEPTNKAKPTAGHDTPEAAFRAYLTGSATGDYDKLLGSLTPDTRAYHIGLCVFSASYFFSEPELKTLLDEHGFTELQRELNESQDTDGSQDEEAAFVQLFLGIKEPAALMTKIEKRSEEVAKKLAADNQELPKAPSIKEVQAAITVDQLKITGDAATARLTTTAPLDVLDIPAELTFRKVAGRWYFDFDPR